MNSKTQKKHVQMSSSSDDVSERAMEMGMGSSPGRARRVSMKIKKGLKDVKGMLSPHHHHHAGDDQQQQQRRRRKPGPNESRRGPLSPVLDRLEKTKSVPIHLDISRAGSLSTSHKEGSSSSSHSCSDLIPDESKTLADIHRHIQDPQGQPVEPESEPEMAAPEPYNVHPPNPQPPDDDDNDDEQIPNPFLVDDPEEPLSDLEPELPTPALVVPPTPSSFPPEPSPSESITLSPVPSQLPLPTEPVPVPPLNIDKPVPAPPPASDSDSEPEPPAVYLPQLVLPTMFLPIPNVRIRSHLTWWLTRRTSIYY
jgi:hypothetical protein